MRTTIIEGAHKKGCTCGFCANRGRFGKKADKDKPAEDADKKPGKEVTAESIVRRLLA